MKQQEIRNQRQRTTLSMKLPRIDPSIITTDWSSSSTNLERKLACKQSDIWNQIHEDFLVQWARECSSRLPSKKKEGRLARFLNTIVNSCVEINELLDESPEIWAAEEGFAKKYGEYFMETDLVKGTKQKKNADGTEHIRLRAIREQFAVHLAERVLATLDKLKAEEADEDNYFDDDDDDDDAGDSDDDDNDDAYGSDDSRL